MIARLLTALIICAVFLNTSSAATAAKNPWQVFSNVVYVAEDNNGGDNFHVKCDEEDFVFQFYCIDCPEPDFNAPERLKEQSDYFGVTTDQIVRAGQAARDLVKQRLSDKPFVLWTRHAKAGRAKGPRYYGFIQVDDQWLHLELLKKGLARVKGVANAPPDGESSKSHLVTLNEAEKAAKDAGLGAWQKAVTKDAGPAPKP